MGGCKIPLSIKLAYTAFMCVLVPFYWSAYGPTNFLYFCDVALFLTLVGVWLESPLLIGVPTVGILLPQMLWVIDFTGGLLGHHVFETTTYMFKKSIPLFARGLSLFHGWLPFLLVFLVWNLGYDRRSLVVWTVTAWVLIAVCYLWMPAPPAPKGSNEPVNINYVYGPSDDARQTWVSEHAWLAFIVVAFPLAFYVPAHYLMVALDRWRRSRAITREALGA